jgi:hypothetical protein
MRLGITESQLSPERLRVPELVRGRDTDLDS